MTQLSKKEGRAILDPVPYKQWLSAGRMHMPSGIHRELLGSLREVHHFLEPSSKSLAAIDFDKLANWLETTIKDKLIAQQVRKAKATGSCHVETCKAVHKLIEARIEEAEGVLNDELS